MRISHMALFRKVCGAVHWLRVWRVCFLRHRTIWRRNSPDCGFRQRKEQLDVTSPAGGKAPGREMVHLPHIFLSA